MDADDAASTAMDAVFYAGDDVTCVDAANEMAVPHAEAAAGASHTAPVIAVGCAIDLPSISGQVAFEKMGEIKIVVILRADRNCKYADVWSVLHSCQRAGFKHWQMRVLTQASATG